MTYSTEWNFYVFWVSPTGIKPANLQSSSVNMPSISFSGSVKAHRNFAGFEIANLRNLRETCKAHALLFLPCSESREGKSAHKRRQCSSARPRGGWHL